MKEILLSKKGKNKLKLVTLVDDEDFEYLNQWNWCSMNNRYTNYVMRTVRKTNIFMHRVIMNTPPDMQTDHRDRNGLNNQKHNLRNCTSQQNNINRGPVKNKSSLYKGVSLIERNNNHVYIRADIRINKKVKYLGSFKSEIDAAIAYDNAARNIHGEFASLNFK